MYMYMYAVRAQKGDRFHLQTLSDFWLAKLTPDISVHSHELETALCGPSDTIYYVVGLKIMLHEHILI